MKERVKILKGTENFLYPLHESNIILRFYWFWFGIFIPLIIGCCSNIKTAKEPFLVYCGLSLFFFELWSLFTFWMQLHNSIYLYSTHFTQHDRQTWMDCFCTFSAKGCRGPSLSRQLGTMGVKHCCLGNHKRQGSGQYYTKWRKMLQSDV